MPQLIVLEDDRSVREDLVEYLTQCGYGVTSVRSLTEFRALSCYQDIAILDVTLPDGEGFEAVELLREQSPNTGIILLTGRSHLHDKLRGLMLGADHYLTKPFLLEELAAIVAALLRRTGAGWRLDRNGHRLLDPVGNSLALKALEFSLFERLIDQKGGVLSRHMFISDFSGRLDDFDERRLDTAICRLRGRWQAANGNSLPLKTRHRVGYYFSESLSWF